MIGLTLFGALGYIEKIYNLQWPRKVHIGLLALFLTLSAANIIFSYYKDRASGNKIAGLERKANILHSIELHGSVDAKTPDTPVTESQTSAGMQSAVAFFTEDGTRYRFVTDFQFSQQQVAPNLRRISFVYKPEDPSQLLGRQISFLENINRFAFNYSAFFKTVGFGIGSQYNSISLTVFVNGVDLGILSDLRVDPGLVASRQVNIDVTKGFSNISQRYALQLKKREADER